MLLILAVADHRPVFVDLLPISLVYLSVAEFIRELAMVGQGGARQRHPILLKMTVLIVELVNSVIENARADISSHLPLGRHED